MCFWSACSNFPCLARRRASSRGSPGRSFESHEHIVTRRRNESARMGCHLTSIAKSDHSHNLRPDKVQSTSELLKDKMDSACRSAFVLRITSRIVKRSLLLLTSVL